MTLPHSWTFRRTESDGTRFSDLGISLSNSVKFDVFDETIQLATLVTNNRETYALTQEGFRLSLRTKSDWFGKSYYYLVDGSGETIATIFVHNRFLRPNLYTITFNKTNAVYFLSKRNYRETKDAKAAFIYDLGMDDETFCTIVNNRKPPLVSIATSTRLEGVIHFGGDLGLSEILCFLQLIQVHIDTEHRD